MKKALWLLLGISTSVSADYALVVASSGPTLKPLTSSKTLEQCEKTKANFEITFKDIQYSEKGKERYRLQCVELADGTTI